MTLNIYKVKITYEVLVLAEDSEDAYYLTKENVEDIVDDQEYTNIEVVEQIESVHSDWIGAIPYGDNPNAFTCDEILKNGDKKKELIESLSDEQKYQLLSTLPIVDIENLIQKVN